MSRLVGGGCDGATIGGDYDEEAKEGGDDVAKDVHCFDLFVKEFNFSGEGSPCRCDDIVKTCEQIDKVLRAQGN
jgi:hypothetical protein